MNDSGTAVSKNTRTRKGNKGDIASNGFFQLAPRTHDSSLAGEHIPNIKHLVKDLEASVHAVWPRRHELRYSNVQVLLISWEADDLGVVREVLELQHVFEDLYHYDVQVYKIPDIKPDKALKRRMIEFLDEDGEATLLILYYAGHAKKSPHSNEPPRWLANRKPNSPFLPSGGIQSMMEEADSDALLLYDCCNAAATTTSDSQQGQRGVTEVIAACGYESIASEVGEHSFTNALMETLAAAAKAIPFSVGELHNRIMNRLKCWVPSVVKNEDGKMKEDSNGRLEYEKQPRTTPIYSILCESKPRRSILLAPLRKKQRGLSAQSAANGHAQNGESSASICIGKRKRSLSPRNENGKCSQVILSIQLRGDGLDIPAWKECIRLFPAEAKGIKIEGIYDSFSTLLLIRMPVAVWNLLPQNSAYNFVGYVTSENRAAAKLREASEEVHNISAFTENPTNKIEGLKCASCRNFRQKCIPANPNINQRTWIDGGQQDKCTICVQYGHPCGPPEDLQSLERTRSQSASAVPHRQDVGAMAQTTNQDLHPGAAALPNSVEIAEAEPMNLVNEFGTATPKHTALFNDSAYKIVCEDADEDFSILQPGTKIVIERAADPPGYSFDAQKSLIECLDAAVRHAQRDTVPRQLKELSHILHTNIFIEVIQKALQESVATHNLDIIKLLMKIIGNIDFVDKCGNTLLNLALASQYPSTEVVKYLVDFGVDLQKQNSYGTLPLHLAACHDDAKLIQILLEKLPKDSPQLLTKTTQGNTALLCAVSLPSNDDTVEALLNHQASTEFVAHSCEGFGLIHYASCRMTTHVLEKLIERGIDIYDRTPDGCTAMHYAAKNSFSSEHAKLLLKKGMSHSLQDKNGYMPIHVAADSVHSVAKEILEHLLQSGADINAWTINGQTPLHFAIGSPQKTLTETNDFMVEMLLDCDGLDVNSRDDFNMSPLIYCCKKFGLRSESQNSLSLRILGRLLDKGADPKLKDMDGTTALHYLCKNGAGPLVDLAIDMVHKKSPGFEARNSHGQSCFDLLLNSVDRIGEVRISETSSSSKEHTVSVVTREEMRLRLQREVKFAVGQMTIAQLERPLSDDRPPLTFSVCGNRDSLA